MGLCFSPKPQLRAGPANETTILFRSWEKHRFKPDMGSLSQNVSRASFRMYRDDLRWELPKIYPRGVAPLLLPL